MLEIQEAPGESDSIVSDSSLKKKLIKRFLVAILALVGILAFVGYFVKEPVIAASRWFVRTLGTTGIFLGFFTADAFPLPIWHDAFLALGLLGGLRLLDEGKSHSSSILDHIK